MKFKKTIIFITSLLLIYLAVGFYIVPTFGKEKITNLLEENLKRDVTLESLNFNPLTFELKCGGLEIKQKNSRNNFVSLENLSIDIDIKNYKTILIKTISINSPNITIAMDKNSSFNFDDLLVSDENKTSAPSPIDILLGEIFVKDGKINFKDVKKDKTFNFSNIGYHLLNQDGKMFHNLNLKLNQTDANILATSLGDNLDAKININAIKIEEFKTYYSEFINFVPRGELSINTKIDYTDGKLNIDKSTLILDEIEIDLDKKRILQATTFQIQNFNIDLDKKILDVGAIKLQDSFLDLQIDKNRNLNLSNLVKQSDEQNSSKSGDEKKWAITLQKTDIINMNMRFSDFNYKKPFNLSNIDLSLDEFSLNDGEKSNFSFGSDLIKIEGKFGLNPFLLNSKISLNNFDVSKLKQFIEKQTNIEAVSGKIDVGLEINYDKKLEVKNGNLKILDLKIMQKRLELAKIAQFEVKNFWIDLEKENINISEILLKNSRFRGELYKDGKLNFETIMKKSGEEQSGENSWKLNVNKINLLSNSFNFEDKSKKTKFKLSNINIKIDKFSTNKKSKFKINSSLRLNSSYLSYYGKIGLEPFVTNGKVKLKNFDLAKIKPYFEDFVNLKLKSGILNFDGKIDYGKKFSLIGAGTEVRDLVAYQDKLKVIDLKSLRLKKVNFRNANFLISNLILDRLNIKSILYKNGELNFSKILKPQKEEKNKTKSKPINLRIEKVVVKNSGFFMQNRQNLSDVKIDKINLSLKKFSTIKTRIFPFDLRFETFGSKIESDGFLGISPLLINANLNFKNLDLTNLNSYLKDYLNLKIRSLNLGMNGYVRYKNEKLRFYGGLIKLNKIDLDGFMGKKLLKSDLIMFNGLDFRQKPDRLKIKKITLKKTHLNYKVFKDGNSSISKIFKNQEKKKKDTKEESFPLDIGKISIDSFDINYKDLENPLSLKLVNLKGDVSNISTTKMLKSFIDLEMQVNKYGYAKINSGIYFKNFKRNSDISLAIYNIELKLFNHYAKKFIGYEIKRGTLVELKSKTKILNSKLNSENRIKIDNLRLKNPTLILKTSLQAIKNSQGILSFPINIKGNIDEPKFKISKIISIAFSNLLGNIITTPIKFVESIFHIKGNKVEGAIFNAGSSTLLPPTIAQLNGIAKILKNKKRRILVIRHSYNKNEDGDALENRYIQNLTKNLYETNSITKALKKEFLKYYRSSSFVNLQNRYRKEFLNEKLKEMIKKAIFIGENNLEILARNRTQNIYNYLINKGVEKKKLKINYDYLKTKKEVMTKLKIEFKFFW